MILQRLRQATLILLCAVVVPVYGANIYLELGDAGQTLATANLVNTLPAGTTLDAIRGSLGTTEADIFAIYLTGGQSFSATTSGSSIAFNAFDTQLFLFNSLGLGVYANDDDNVSPPQSTLLSGVSLTPATSGVYYLAISGSGFLPVSSGGYIFPVSGGLLNQGGSGDPVGATGPGGALALSNWLGVSNESGSYEIVLTGAQFLPRANGNAPEPGTILLVAFGCAAAGAFRRFQRN